jgi:hypothetical protein
MPNPITDFLKKRYIDGGAGINNLDWSNIAKDVGVAGALYGIINPNDSSGLASFFGTGGRQQPVGYTGGIPNYTATRELAPNAFAQTYTTPTGEIAPRRPGAAGRRYFTDTAFTQSTTTPFMGITAEQIAAQNQAAQEERDLFETLLGSAATQRETQAAEQAAAEQAAAQQLAAQQAAAQQLAAQQLAAQQAATTPVVEDEYKLDIAGDIGEIATTSVTPYGAIPVDQDYTQEEKDIVAQAIASGEATIPQVAGRFGVTTGDVIEELLRGGYQTPEQVVESLGYTGGVPGLIVELAAQGRTNPEEIVGYFGNNPAYPEYQNVTVDEVSDYLRRAGVPGYAGGGMMQGRGYYLGGPTDGMADQIPATINNIEPARLSDGEFVIPADVVSHLGNGNSDAGAQNLYSMMERVRRDRTGNPEQGRQIDPNKYLA